MIHNIPDVTPGGSPVPLAAERTPANWLQIICPAANSNPIRIGDRTTSASSGLAIPAGGGMMLPAISDTQYLDLALIYIYGTGSDKVSIAYGRH